MNKLNKEQINEVEEMCENLMPNGLRKGQNFFKALYVLYPHVAGDIWGGDYDPSYNNEIEKCINYISDES